MESSPKIGMDIFCCFLLCFFSFFFCFCFHSQPFGFVLSVYAPTMNQSHMPQTTVLECWSMTLGFCRFHYCVKIKYRLHTDLQVNKGSPWGFIIIKLGRFFLFYLPVWKYVSVVSRGNSFLFPQIVDDCHLRFAVTTKKKNVFFFGTPRRTQASWGQHTIRQAPTHSFFPIYV